jgi:hypothetical protein
MSDKAGSARSEQDASLIDADELSSSLGEVRRELSGEVKLRQTIIKPVERAIRALKDPHKNALALHEAGLALEKPPEELELPRGYKSLIGKLRGLADAKLSELEFSFARDLREAFKEKGVALEGPPTELIAELFVIRPDLRQKQVQMTFSRQPVTRKAIKLDVDQVVAAYERARREICEREVNLDALLAELFEAYQRTLRLAEKQMGARMGIVDCYRELILVRQPLSFRRTPSKLSFVDYPKSHFAYDMLELRRRHKLIHEGWRLNLGVATIDVGADSTRAIFLATGATEGQFIKDIYFTAEKAK